MTNKIMMKRGYILGILILVLLSMPLISAMPGIEITPAGYSPSPVETEGNFKLSFDIKNIGSSETLPVTCVLDLRYGLALFAGSLESSIGTILPGKTRTIEYEIRVGADVSRGSQNINLKCKEGDDGQWVSKDALVEVESKYGTLNTVNVRTDPAIVEPGQKAALYITLDNSADYMMNEINVKLNFTGVDIAPYGESAEKKINSISARTSKDISFGIIALPQIAGGIYKIPVEITYKDVTTKSYAVSSYVSIEIGSQPEIDTSIESTTLYGSRNIGNVVIKLVNKGLTGLKLLNIQLQSTKNFTILSSDSAYIGNLDSDDYETAEFKIKILTGAKNVPLPLLLQFRDSSNNLYSIEKTILLKRLSASEAEQGSSAWIIIIPIILAIAAYLFYKRHLKKYHSAK